MRWAVCTLALWLVGSAVHADTFTCRHVEVTHDGLQVAGIEDLVHHKPSDTLILSAHDRWGDQDGDSEALMGLFALSMNELSRAEKIEVRRLAGELSQPMRPHGLAIRERADGEWRLAVIDHRFLQESERNGEPGTLIRDYAITGDGMLREQRMVGHPDLCPANDLDWLDDDRLITSLDRTNCGGFWRFLELSRGQWRGRLAAVDMNGSGKPEILAEALGFPNGILVRDGRIFVSFSREERVASYSYEDGSLTQQATIALQGGGDNFSTNDQGDLLLAVHPDLWNFGLYTLRTWGFDSAPTMLVRIASELSAPEVLLQSDEGHPLSGVTGFVDVNGTLIGGAAFDEGLAVCELK